MSVYAEADFTLIRRGAGLCTSAASTLRKNEASPKSFCCRMSLGDSISRMWRRIVASSTASTACHAHDYHHISSGLDGHISIHADRFRDRWRRAFRLDSQIGSAPTRTIPRRNFGQLSDDFWGARSSGRGDVLSPGDGCQQSVCDSAIQFDHQANCKGGIGGHSGIWSVSLKYHYYVMRHYKSSLFYSKVTNH